ncbi:MAG: DUF2993 domain-containing protein [Cyanobacteria bacterium P01_D01_bin.128]
MELISILLTSLLALLSPVGIVVDQLATNALREQLIAADELAVRVDNAPSYQLLQGKVSHIRIAGRGLVPIDGLRIARIDVETDTVDLDIGRLQQGEVLLEAPFQAAVNIELTEADLNQFLISPAVTEQLSDLRFNLLPGSREALRYQLKNPRLDFISGNRLRFQVQLEDTISSETLSVVAETGFVIAGGAQLELVEPEILVDDSPVPRRILRQVVDGVNQNLSLEQIEASGVTARVLSFEIDDDGFALALFAQVEPIFLTQAGIN